MITRSVFAMLTAVVTNTLAGCASMEPTVPASAFYLSSPGMADNTMLDRKYAGNVAKNPNCLGQNVSPALATSYALVNPGLAVILGVILGGEIITGSAFVALPLIVLGVAFVFGFFDRKPKLSA